MDIVKTPKAYSMAAALVLFLAQPPPVQATIGASSPCQHLNKQLAHGAGTGVESEVYLDANMLQNHITTLDGTLAPLFAHKSAAVIKQALAITGDRSKAAILARDWTSGTTAEQKHALLSLSMADVDFSDANPVIPGVKLMTSFVLSLDEPLEIFGTRLPTGTVKVDLSPYVSEKIEVANTNEPLPLRHIEVHFTTPERAGATLESVFALEKALGWQVGARHVHMIAETPKDMFAKDTPIAHTMQTGFAITELLRVASLAIEMLAVTKANDSLERFYYYKDRLSHDKVSFGGVYRDDQFLSVLDISLRPFTYDEDTIVYLKLGTIGYKPRGNYQDPNLYGFELRIVHPEFLPAIVRITDLVHQSLMDLDPNNLDATPQFIKRASFKWLRDTVLSLPENELFPKHYIKAAVYNREWADLLKTIPAELKPYRKALHRLEQATLDENGLETKKLQVKWLVHDWRQDPLFAIVEEEGLNYILREQVRYLKKLEEDDSYKPQDAAREFAETSKLAKLFLGMFRVNYADL